jgi:RimJ/RimL family protein N-acetyltransferase
MSEHRFWGGSIRKVWASETDRFRAHLMRLDKESRRLRFAHVVSDSFVEEYAAHVHDGGGLLYGFFHDGELRAAAELRKIGQVWGKEAEAAFSVEKEYQDRGIGNELMGRVIRAARNRGIQHLYVSCLAENRKMIAIAKKHDADLRFEYGEVLGDIVPTEANYVSILAEAVEDRVGYMLAVLDIQSRLRSEARPAELGT